MTRVEANARQLVGHLVLLVDKLHHKCQANSKVAIEIGDNLNEVTNAMMNLGKALDEAGVPKPNIGVELVTKTTRDDEHLTFETGVRMRPLTPDEEAKLGQYDEFDKRFADPDVAGAVRKKANAIRQRLHNAVADNTPGDRIEDRRLDVLIDELAIVIAELNA